MLLAGASVSPGVGVTLRVVAAAVPAVSPGLGAVEGDGALRRGGSRAFATRDFGIGSAVFI